MFDSLWLTIKHCCAVLALFLAAAIAGTQPVASANEVVIVIPGIGGSELHRNGRQIWPPYDARSVVNINDMLRDDLVAPDIVREVWVGYVMLPQYSRLVYLLNQLGFNERNNTLIVCPYDWRRGNEQSAEQLAQRIDDAVQNRGATKINLIAHSMGGLVARYYLEKGDFDGRPGFGNVARLVTIATPHRGAPETVVYARGSEKWLWLEAQDVRTLSRDDRFLSLYQLMPPEGEPFAWSGDPGSEYEPVNIYEARVSQGLGLKTTSLDAATRFHAVLQNGPNANVRYFAFFGASQQTATALQVNESAGWSVRKMIPHHSGDGRVPTWSATLTGWQNFAVGGDHGNIYWSISLQETLARLLGRGYFFSRQRPLVELAVSRALLNVGETCNASLSVNGPITLDGEVRLERVVIDAKQETVRIDQVERTVPIQTQSADVHKLAFSFEMPTAPGVYRLAYFPAGDDSHPLVQETLLAIAAE